MTNENKSQIYGQGYEKWDGSRDFHIPSWLLIGKTVLRNVLTPSGCMGRLVFIFVFVIPLGIYYFNIFATSLVQFQAENLRNSEYFGFFANFLLEFGLSVSSVNKHFILFPSLLFVPLAMIFFGSQLISKDKAANALQVYFAKALSRTDYILGKFFAVGVLTSLVTLAPSAIIILVGLFFTTDHLQFMQDAWYIPLLTGLYWLLLTGVFGSITLTFSAMFDKAYMAAVGVIGFLFFCMAFSELAVLIFGALDILNGMNWVMSLHRIGNALYSLEVENWSLLIWSMIDLILISGICLLLIYKRINPVEVIK